MQSSLPVIGVLVVMSLVATVAYFVYEANRHGATLLSNDLVTAIEKRVSVEMYSYLEPSQRLIELVDAAVDGRPVFEGREEAEAFARHALPTIASATGVGYADADGNFLYVLHNQNGSVDTKLIDRRNGGHRVTRIRRNPAGETIATTDEPTDTFDPRERPWYIRAADAKKPFWTDTYQNLTLNRPALSHVIPRYGPDGRLRTVIGIDIELEDLCVFLSRLTIGLTGKAYIINRSGFIVAFPSDHWTPANREGARPPRLDELGDPVLTRAYNRLRVEGFGRMVLDFGDRRVIVSSEPVKMLAGHDWLVLIVVPESDFIGFVTDSSLVAAAMLIVVVILIIGLAGLLGWRNIVAGRRVAAATVRQQTLEERTRAFIDLAHVIAESGAEGPGLEAITETACDACAARRAAVWRMSVDGQMLSCEDYYERAAKDHASGVTIHRDEVPVLFAALDEGAIIDTIGAPNDKRIPELAATYLRPLRIDHIYIAPIMHGGRALGMLSVEDPQAGEHAAGLAAFCDALAVLLALRFGRPLPGGEAPPAALADKAEPHAQAATAAASQDAFPARQARLEQTLIRNDTLLKDLATNAVARAAIGVIKLPEWATVARQPPDSTARTEMDAIVRELRSVIERSDLSYAAQLDDQIVIAAYSPGEATAARDARCVATALLEMRDRMTRLEEKWRSDLDFRFAIDVGTVMASAAEGSPQQRRLWGGAIGVARILAMTTARHTIAASETAYQLLSSHYFLRPRGTYFLPEAGNMRTFIMVGSL